jgi:hypothetical protein
MAIPANSARKCNLTFCPGRSGAQPEAIDNHYFKIEQQP